MITLLARPLVVAVPVLVATLVVAPALAGAQDAVQIPMQFDFVNPGAKSLALAGAFTGLADDATAGFANPAGLRELGRAELSIEGRGRWLETSFLQRGRLSGPVQNEGTDVIAGPVFGTSTDNSFQLPYFAAVLPRPEQRWVVAAFRHELARVDQTFFAEGVFQQDPAELTSRRSLPQEGLRQIAITSYGAAGAVELTSRVAVGAAFNIYTFDLTSDFRRFDVDGFLGPPLPNTVLGRSTQEGEDIAFGPTVGVRMCVKACSDRQTTSARFGVVYRHGPTFEYDTRIGGGPNPTVRIDNRFRVPHVFAVGGAVEIPGPDRRLVLTGEIRRITYSRLFDDFIVDQALASGMVDRLRIPDGTEVHFGVQYTLPSVTLIPRLRAGIWSDPDHSVQFIPQPPADHPERRLDNERMSTALSTGGRRTHVTAGVGLTLSPALEWNTGVDFASNISIFSTSVIVTLGQ